MKIFSDLTNKPLRELQYLSHEDYQKRFNKGWSYSYSYSLTELRDIYLKVKEVGFEDISTFTKKCIESGLPYEKKPWKKRRVLEQINSLKNFGLLSENLKITNSNYFSNSSINTPLNSSDLQIFKNIYFSYFRFREIHSWLINPDSYNLKAINKIDENLILDKSNAVLAIRSKDRFVDSFTFSLENNPIIYKIAQHEKKDFEGMRRFWDVYVKWGKVLGLAQTLNLSDLEFELLDMSKSPSLFYFPKPIDPKFDLSNYLFDNYKQKYIYIPKLVLSIATKFRFSFDSIIRLILDTAKVLPDKISLQKTSDILMRKDELKLLPNRNGFIFSHILLIK